MIYCRDKKFKFFLLLCCFLCSSPALANPEPEAQQNDISTEISTGWETDFEEEEVEEEDILSWGYYHNLDLYYTSAGVIINLSDSAIPDIGIKRESQVYLDLFKRSGIPQYVLFEFSIYPMPVTGVYLREEHENFYEDASIGNDFNLIESVTAGFEEPYALSIFLNNMVTYGAKGDLENSNRGFMGYLLSGGNYHIQRNRLVRDNWLELEWKIKGDIQRDDERLSWSFRLGGKFHNHSEIIDTLYVVLRRSQVAINKPILSFLYNTSFEFTYKVSQRNLNGVGYQVFMDKKIPLNLGGTIFSIGLGLIHESNKKYLGELRETQREDNQTFVVIRPSFEF